MSVYVLAFLLPLIAALFVAISVALHRRKRRGWTGHGGDSASPEPEQTVRRDLMLYTVALLRSPESVHALGDALQRNDRQGPGEPDEFPPSAADQA